MSILSLPSTTDDLVLDELSPSELFKYGRTCKAIHSIVQSYLPRAFQLYKLLAPYFSPSQVDHLRRLQASTGMLISGSTALQFFDRVVYPDSDLDLYLEHVHREVVGLWLLEIGYKYVPRQKSNSQTLFADDLELNPDPTPGQLLTQRQFIHSGQAYLEAKCVFTFAKQLPYRKVQLITSLNSPLERILNFHSTCVMNIITHDTAYAFFPRGTFEERRALTCVDVSPNTTIAQTKYEKRGWIIDDFISRNEFDDPEFAFARGLRYVGDAQSWTMPILPKMEALPSSCKIESNSWLLQYDNMFSLSMSYNVVKSPRLRFSYLIEGKDDHLQLHLVTEIDQVESDDETEETLTGKLLDDKLTDLIDWYRAGHYSSDTCPYSFAMRRDEILANARSHRQYW